MTKYKTAESVRRGHPDKLCDLIADSILDECLRHDRYSRCACEVMATKGKIFVCGEITCAAKINIRSVVREVLRKVGYAGQYHRVRQERPAGETLSQTRPDLVPEGLYQRHDPQTGRGGGEAVSLLSELKTVADACSIPVETGVFSGVPPDLYLLITPMADTFELHADNSPGYDTQEARLSLFVKGSYTATKDTLVRALLGADFCITDRRYIAHEDDTGFHHYAIDVAKLYQL